MLIYNAQFCAFKIPPILNPIKKTPAIIPGLIPTELIIGSTIVPTITIAPSPPRVVNKIEVKIKIIKLT